MKLTEESARAAIGLAFKEFPLAETERIPPDLWPELSDRALARQLAIAFLDLARGER